METLLIVLFAWAEASIGMKILAVLAAIAFFVLFAILPGSERWNPITRRFEIVSDLGCGTRIVIAIVCILIILIALQLDGEYVFWKP